MQGIWEWLALAIVVLVLLAGIYGYNRLVFSIGFGVPSLIVFTLARRQADFAKQLGLMFCALLFVWPVPVGLWMLASVVALPVIILLGLCWLLVALFYFWLPASSLEGRRLLDALEGYRNYLQLAEGDTLLQAGGAPAMSIALYEQHLPFAMALGVEAQWSARFSAALASGLLIDSAQRDYQPSWYHSHGQFSSALAMSSALSNNLSSFTASAASPPSSPSSSGGGGSSGGSSGGGSSGGGGGGGGGGGW